MWWLFALGSSVFAALTSILAKIGVAGVNSNLATAHNGCAGDGLGHGFPDTYAGRFRQH